MTRDNQPPTVAIDFPIDGSEVTLDAVDVSGRVGDLLSGFMGLSVVVNGNSATVDPGIGTNGTFIASGIASAARSVTYRGHSCRKWLRR